jgi:glycine/D-amino acid oxidase-like deaminating enzyme
VLPAIGRHRYSFATNDVDAAYGSIDRHNRIIFGIGATAFRDPDPERMARGLFRVLPGLAVAHRAVTGRSLSTRPLVRAERLCFTTELLPNVGIAGRHGRILYAHALGGHGIAVGVMLGRAAAERTWSEFALVSDDGVFEAFAAVPHGWLPPWQPARTMAAAIGLALHGLFGRL